MLRASIALVAVFATSVVVQKASDPHSGHVLVANQQSASASLIDLSNDSAKIIPVGVGPHEAVISPSGRVGIVTIYGISGTRGAQDHAPHQRSAVT